MSFQAVLFDLDGTLLDTAPDFALTLNKLLAAHKRSPLPEHEVRTIVTDGSAALVAHAFDCQPEGEEFEQIREQFLALYRDNVCKLTQPFPGIETVLSQLGKAGIPWGVVTNKPSPYTLAILDTLLLEPPPQTIICPDHVTNTKPNPEPVLLACEQLGIAPDATLFVGDHPRDIDAGHAAGTTTVAVTYGYIPEDDDISTWGAHHTIDEAHELLSILF